jgi:thioredoxin reductase/NAD-dependent dihydropyrimidine dehydrogenase PreA subunit
MDTFLAFILAATVVFFFVRRYVKQLASVQRGGAHSVPAGSATAAPASGKPAARATGGHACPRCGKAISATVAFCSHCGAALAMWSVHRSEVKSGQVDATGKVTPVINASLCIGCGSCVEVCPEKGTLEMVSGKAILAHAERCTGHAKCAEVCPTQAIALSRGGVLQRMRVPLVKDDFESNVPGLFIIGELGGMGLIKTAVNEGKLAIDHIKKRMDAAQPAAKNGKGANGHATPAAAGAASPDAAAPADVLIVGAGPAGLSASLSAQQLGLRYVTLEQGEVAATIRQYPRHKFLMAEPIEIPLYGPLYVADGTKESLLSVWETIIQNTGVRIETNRRVERIVRNGGSFRVESGEKVFDAKYVVLAMGRRGAPLRLGIPGEDLGKVAYRLIEAESYNDADILVVGGGDSAVEAALALSRSGRNRVTVAYRGEEFSRLRDRNREQFEAGEREGRLTVLRKTNLLGVRPEGVLLECDGKIKELPNQYVFVLIGGTSPEEFLQKTGVEIVEKELSAQAW